MLIASVRSYRLRVIHALPTESSMFATEERELVAPRKADIDAKKPGVAP